MEKKKLWHSFDKATHIGEKKKLCHSFGKAAYIGEKKMLCHSFCKTAYIGEKTKLCHNFSKVAYIGGKRKFCHSFGKTASFFPPLINANILVSSVHEASMLPLIFSHLPICINQSALWYVSHDLNIFIYWIYLTITIYFDIIMEIHCFFLFYLSTLSKNIILSNCSIYIYVKYIYNNYFILLFYFVIIITACYCSILYILYCNVMYFTLLHCFVL